MSATTLLVQRGKPVSLTTVHGLCAELLGGHLRPDAWLAVSASAHVRVDRRSHGSADPLNGTVRAFHFATPESCADGLLTDLSWTLLRSRLGFPEEHLDQLHRFGPLPAEAVALRLSKAGPVASLYLDDEAQAGAYAVFSKGRRLWSAWFRAAGWYATFDGSDVQVSPMEANDPVPPEGDPGQFPAHGLSLLFGADLSLSPAERLGLLPTLLRASRPPTVNHESMLLVQEGRFLAPGQPLKPLEWKRFKRSWVG